MNSLENLNLDSNAKNQIRQCLKLIHGVLGNDLLGAYLYGSALLGGLQKYSDIDLFIVSNRATSSKERATLVATLLNISDLSYRGFLRPIELTIVEKSKINPWQYPPHFDFQYGEWLREPFLQGNFEPWSSKEMPDIALLITQILLSSIPLVGIPAEQLLCQVPHHDFILALQDALPNLMTDLKHDTRNVLLTLARIWVTVATNTICSKPEAANWAMRYLPNKFHPVLERAMAICLGKETDYWNDIDKIIRPCAEFILGEISKKIVSVTTQENTKKIIEIKKS